MSLPHLDSSSCSDSSHSKHATDGVPSHEDKDPARSGRSKTVYFQLSAMLGFKERFSLTFCKTILRDIVIATNPSLISHTIWRRIAWVLP